MPASVILQHPFDPQPEQRIWRYLSLEKFIHLLSIQCLFFCRIGQLGDPFEGSITDKDLDFREFSWGFFDAMRQSGEISGPCETRAEFDERTTNTNTILRQSTYVSCWHANDHESAAMWSLYTGQGRGIAIRSTCAKLARCLPDGIEIGKVRYVDPRQDRTPQRIHANILQKLRSYEHEREVRAIYFDPSSFNAPEVGKLVPVQLDELTEEVYVAPGSSPLFREVVQQCMDKFGLKKMLQPSGLDDKPIF